MGIIATSGRKPRTGAKKVSRAWFWAPVIIVLLLLAYTGLAYIPIAIDQAAFARELKRASQLSNGKAELARYSRAKGGDLSYFKQDGQVVGFYASPDYATLSPIASQHFYTKIYFKGDRVTDWDDIEVGTVAP